MNDVIKIHGYSLSAAGYRLAPPSGVLVTPLVMMVVE
jgi:hypothetical protein